VKVPGRAFFVPSCWLDGGNGFDGFSGLNGLSNFCIVFDDVQDKILTFVTNLLNKQP